MKLLYFEDDAIDQRLFQRACKNLIDVEITILDSFLELKDDFINSFDGVIIDQYLKDCSAVQLQERNISIPVAVLSASEKLNGSQKSFIGIWQKPIKENALEDILKQMKSLKGNSLKTSISLEYIEELTQGDEAEKQELLQSIYLSIEENNQSLEQFEQLTASEIQQLLHKQKSKVGIFYLEKLHGEIDQAENSLKNGDTKEMLISKVANIVEETKKILTELKALIG